MKKILRKLIDAITFPFVAIAIHIDESRRINEDGSWTPVRRRKRKKKK